MSYNNGMFELVQAGSGFDPEKPADPSMIRYRTSIYPEEVGVELLVRDLEEFRAMANAAEPRMRPFLLQIAYAMDCALAAKSSEGGKMLDLITTVKSQQNLFSNIGGDKKKKDQFDQLNEMFGDFTAPKTDIGNKNY